MMADKLLNAQDLITAKKHDTFRSEVITGKAGGLSTGANIDYATNAVTGQVQDTLPHVLSKVGFVPAGFDFTTGGTVTMRNQAVYFATDGNWYSWGGALPKVVAPASTPTGSGGISPSAWNVSTSAFMYRDWQGFTDALLSEAGIVDDGQPDAVGNSQRMEALKAIFLQKSQNHFVSPVGFATLQDAITSSEGKTIKFPDGLFVITSSLLLPSDIDIQLSPNTEIRCTTPNVSNFIGIGKTNIRITGGNVASTVQGTSGVPSGIYLKDCSGCHVSQIKFTGMQLSSVRLEDCEDCVIEYNLIKDINGMSSVGADTCDIALLGNSHKNSVFNNWCYGETAIGILVQGVPAGTTPMRNTISQNYVNEKTGYGILAYQITNADTHIKITENTVWNVLGTHVAGASGSGIYVQTSGGAIVTGNHVRNCCRSTTSALNAPAGISIASDAGSLEACIISNNHVDALKWWGIHMSDSSGRFICDSNRVRFADPVNGVGIRLLDASRSIISNNEVAGPDDLARSGILVQATGTSITRVSVVGNTVNGLDGVLINIAGQGSNTISGVFANNTANGSGANSQALTLTRVVNSAVNANQLSGGFSGLFLTGDCQNIAGSGNVTFSRVLGGANNVNCHFDDSNQFNMANTAGFSLASGLTIEQRFTSPPSGGDWTRGCRVAQSLPAVGSPKGWICTAAGSPGTWVSEGAL